MSFALISVLMHAPVGDDAILVAREFAGVAANGDRKSLDW